MTHRDTDRSTGGGGSGDRAKQTGYMSSKSDADGRPPLIRNANFELDTPSQARPGSLRVLMSGGLKRPS